MALTNNYMADAPFLTGAQVINFAFTNQNTDVSLISLEIRVLAEIAHLKESIGSDFYIHLKDAFQNGTETADEIILMNDWIMPTLAWFTRFELIVEIQHQSTSSGIVSNIPEFASAVSSTELNVYKQDTYRKGKVMLKELIVFLDENSSEFPEYGSETSSLCSSGSSVSKQHGMIIY